MNPVSKMTLSKVFGVLLPLVAIFNLIAARNTRGIITVRQDGSRTGHIEKLSTNDGRVGAVSNATFKFDWPLVEMTTDLVHEQVYIITYPDDFPGPVLYQLSNKLEVAHAWETVPYSFFDLQYSSQQNTLYGIYVSSTYGRVLSNFSADPIANTVTHTELFTLPYMWYVNASSFHASNCHYYALINNFPGFANSSLDQQLIVADFSVDIKVAQPRVDVLPITKSQGLVQFIGFSSNLNKLFYLGSDSNRQIALFGTLDTSTGVVNNVIWSVKADAVGPMTIDDSDSAAFLFTRQSGVWSLWNLPFGDLSNGKVVQTYTNSEYVTYFAASSLGF